jgi:predicted NBD/HSP70 family sugar kinase/biotin operon repressor
MKKSPGSLGSLRQRNRLQIIDVLRQLGHSSRVDLARETGLSRSTVSTLVSELQAEGLVVERAPDGEAQPAPPSVGRPAVALTLNPAAGAVVGIDFGHQFVRVAVADLAGVVVQERREEFDVDGDASGAIALAADLVDTLLVEADSTRERTVGIGVAVSAPVLRDTDDPDATSILAGWAGFAPTGELRRRLGRPVLIGNDANLGALAEVRDGAGRGARDVVYVMLSGGIGAGIVLDGRLVAGHRGLTGELGHITVDRDGRICRCGGRGCLETVAAAPAVLGVLRAVHGDDLTLEAAMRLARDGDAGCGRAFADAGRQIGRVVGAVCNLVNPELVIVGGDMSAAGPLLTDAIAEGIAQSAVPAIAADARVVAASLGDRAEVLGAIGLVLAETDARELVAMGAG